jgi:hypothetical protein
VGLAGIANKYFRDVTKWDVIVFLLYIIVFAAIIVADIFYRKPLFDLDLEYIPKI